MKQLEIKNGKVYLDGENIPYVKSYKIASSAESKGIAELTICMDVRINNLVEIESTQK